jgi:hypothetical protein
MSGYPSFAKESEVGQERQDARPRIHHVGVDEKDNVFVSCGIEYGISKVRRRANRKSNFSPLLRNEVVLDGIDFEEGGAEQRRGKGYLQTQ